MEILIVFLFFLIIKLINDGIKALRSFVSKRINDKKKREFSEKYGIGKLPESIKIEEGDEEKYNYFVFRYPYWYHKKKDGTADLRIKDNPVCWPENYLYMNGVVLKTRYPYDLLYVVKALRSKDVKINMCKEEKAKCQAMKNREELLADNTGIQDIIKKYEKQPTDFELLCAELFEKMGYHSEVTPKTNDGGYDIFLIKNNETTIVECKCYSSTNKVGRPAIQKLVGANNVASANKMIFITTSEFSSYAVSYAENAGVELIDGNKLMQYLREYMHLGQQKLEEDINEYQLEIEDMRPYVPDDIYKKYFARKKL